MTSRGRLAAFCIAACMGAGVFAASYAAMAQQTPAQPTPAQRQCMQECNAPFQRCTRARTSNEDVCRQRWHRCRNSCTAQTPPAKK